MQWISPRAGACFPENQSAPKLENRKPSPCSPCAPNLLHVLVSRIPGYHNLCSPVAWQNWTTYNLKSFRLIAATKLKDQPDHDFHIGLAVKNSNFYTLQLDSICNTSKYFITLWYFKLITLGSEIRDWGVAEEGSTLKLSLASPYRTMWPDQHFCQKSV